MKLRPVLSLGVAVFLVTASAARADSDDPFARANKAYADGRFKEAITSYEELVRTGDYSATLFYDLGNAYYRTQDFARAILNYERALALEPNHPETQANLRVARDQARALELPSLWTERVDRFASVNQLAVATTVLTWTSVFSIAALIFGRRRRSGIAALAILALVAGVLLLFLTMAREQGPKGRSLAIVTGSETQARLATADTAAGVLMLPPGSEVSVQRERGDWVYAILPNDLRGWIPAKNIEQVRL